MSSFVRFIVLLVIVGVVGSLALVIFSNAQGRRQQVKDIAGEHELLAEHMRRLSEGLRRGEMAVEWQKVDANDKVLQSSLLIRQYMPMKGDRLKAMPTVRVIIPGSRVCIEGIRLEFGSAYPVEFQEMRGTKMSFFTNVYAEETEKKERFTFWELYQVPQGMEVHALEFNSHVTNFETKLWQLVWDLVQSPDDAKKNDLKVFTPEKVPSMKACREVHKGEFYRIDIGREGVTIMASDNRDARQDMLHEGEFLRTGPSGSQTK
jgi:hypothetical protein